MRTAPLVCILSGALALAPGCRPRPASVPGELPLRLSETGLEATGVRAFSPQYPLWSDGLDKTRWIALPPGTRIDTSDPGHWRFPVGTKLWKEFRLEGRKVETRVMWQVSEGAWAYGTYAWDPEQQEARRVPNTGAKAHLTLPDGALHDLPALADCRACHENGGSPVLGFTALQLAPDRDPLAPHKEPLQPGMVTLDTLAAEGLVSHPAPAPRLAARSPRTRAVLGYLAANCGHCHQATGPYRFTGLDLRTDPAAASEREQPLWRTAVNAPVLTPLPGLPKDQARRITPGDPARSLLLYRLAPRDRVQRMPSLGTARVDHEARALLEAWIREDLTKP